MKLNDKEKNLIWKFRYSNEVLKELIHKNNYKKTRDDYRRDYIKLKNHIEKSLYQYNYIVNELNDSLRIHALVPSTGVMQSYLSRHRFIDEILLKFIKAYKGQFIFSNEEFNFIKDCCEKFKKDNRGHQGSGMSNHGRLRELRENEFCKLFSDKIKEHEEHEEHEENRN